MDTRCSEERARFVDEARKLLGTPWKHVGRGPTGIDCVGLLLVAAQRAGLPAPMEYTSYTRLPVGASLLVEFDKYCAPKSLLDPLPGDILVTRDESVLLPCHCAIIVDRDRIVHAYARARRVVESRLEDFKQLAIRLYEFKQWAPSELSSDGADH